MALSGMSTVEMVEENVAVTSHAGPLSQEDLVRVKSAMEENRQLADLYCTGCEYCMPCPNDVNIPKNLEYMNYLRVYGLARAARDLYGKLGAEGHYIKGLAASACIECGECEPKCPQRIPIIEQLRATAEALG
jgi:predicted aldo/keto reductase-like oxidoreductase